MAATRPELRFAHPAVLVTGPGGRAVAGQLGTTVGTGPVGGQVCVSRDDGGRAVSARRLVADHLGLAPDAVAGVGTAGLVHRRDHRDGLTRRSVEPVNVVAANADV